MCILAHATNKLFRKPEHRSRRTQVLGGAGSRWVGREEVLRGRQRPPSSAPGHRLSVCVVCVCLCVHVRVHTRARLASPLPREAPAFSQSSADPRVLGRLRVPWPEGFWVNSITSQVATVSPEESGNKSQLCLSLVQGYRNHGHTHPMAPFVHSAGRQAALGVALEQGQCGPGVCPRHVSFLHFRTSCRAAAVCCIRALTWSGGRQRPPLAEGLFGSLSPTEMMGHEAGDRAGECSTSAELAGVLASRSVPDSEGWDQPKYPSVRDRPRGGLVTGSRGGGWGWKSLRNRLYGGSTSKTQRVQGEGLAMRQLGAGGGAARLRKPVLGAEPLKHVAGGVRP